MKKRAIHTLLLFSLMMMGVFGACTDSDEISGHDYTDPTRVRVTPSVTDGLEYDVTATRSSGPFERWSIDSVKWKNANFYTYALETHNFLGGNANFQNISDVMDHQLMRIRNAGSVVKFYDENGVEEEKYYSKWRSHRYKFFTYYTGDASIGSVQRTSTKITQNVSIDGHDDLMHGFAYHTDQELARLISRMPNNDETKIFTEGDEGREYLYSGMAGNRGIHPQFHLKHLLSRFNVEVQGTIGDKDRRYSFLQVLIDSVSIMAPSNGVITIANDQWDNEETYRQAYENREILTWGGADKPYGLDIISYPMKDNELLPDVDFNGLNQQIEATGIMETKTYHQVHSLKPTALCDPILLPSVDSTLTLILGYRHIYYDQNETGKWVINWEKTQTSQFRQPYILALPKDVRPYKPGGTYTIRISIYGPEQISVDVLNGELWKPGGDVDIDTGTEDNNIEIL